MYNACISGDQMLESYGATDVGKKRQRNEDSYAVLKDINFFIVADGMGGHNAGDVASATATKTVEAYMMRSHEEREITWPFGIDPNQSFDANRLRTSLKMANHKVWQLADSNPEYNGMGTTVVCVSVRGDVATITSVGDSRCYLFHEGKTAPLTRDDIWLNETWVRKAFTEEQIQKIPLKNVLSKAVGSKEDIDFPILEQKLEPGDVLLLCSDGLHGMISESELHRTLMNYNTDLERLCNTLIQLANEAGGKDNITVVAIRYVKN